MNLLTETIKLKENIEGGYLELAKHLMEIRDKELYADEYENFSYFCQDLKLSEGTASKLITVYKVFVQEKKLPLEKLSKVGRWSFLYNIKDLVDAEEWIDKKITLTSTDFKRTWEEVFGGVDMAKCEHNFVKMQKCTECGLQETEKVAA